MAIKSGIKSYDNYITDESGNHQQVSYTTLAKDILNDEETKTNITKTQTATTMHLIDTVDGHAMLTDVVRNLLDTTAYTPVSDNKNWLNYGSFLQKNNVLEPNTTYTIKSEENIMAYRLLFGGSYDKENVNLKNGVTITTGSTVKQQFHFQATEEIYNSHPHIMLTKGTTAHPYVPQSYEVRSCGKNLFDKNEIRIGTIADTTYAYRIISKVILLAKESQFSILLPDSINVAIIQTSSNYQEIISDSGWKNNGGIVPVSANAKYVYFLFKRSDNAKITINEVVNAKIQIEYGSQTPYEPYHEETVTITPQTEVAYIPTYADGTNIFSDYDVPLTATYNTVTNPEVEYIKEETDKLFYSDVDGDYLHLTGTKNGKVELRELVKNLANLHSSGNNEWWCSVEKGETYSYSFVQDTSTGYNVMIRANEKNNVQEVNNQVTGTYSSGTFTAPYDGTFYINGWSNSANQRDFMLTKGTTPHAYVPYSGYEVKSCGKNLLKYPYKYLENNGSATYSINGLKFDVNSDKSISITGTSTAKTTVYLIAKTEIPSVALIFHTKDGDFSDGVQIQFTYYKKNGVWGTTEYFNKTSSSIKLNRDYGYYDIAVIIESGKTVNTILKPMLNSGDTPLSYEPYQSSQATITQSTDVAYLDTFDGETNIFTDYGVDIHARLPKNDVGRDVAENLARSTANERYISNTITDNAGSHNGIFRGKYLGTFVTDKQWAAIKDGTFYDLYIGDYWTISGHNYRIADLNTFLHCGDTAFEDNHIVVLPDDCLIKANGSTKLMKDTDSTEGGYNGTKWISTYRAQCVTIASNAFGSAHLASHRELICNDVTNGKSSGWDWVTSPGVELPTEVNIYGTNVWGDGTYNVGINKTQFALCRLYPQIITNNSINWWLRDVAGANVFAVVRGRGTANVDGATNVWGGFRPYVVLKG